VRPTDSRPTPRVYQAEHRSIRPTGGRTWWAHLEFTPINIELTILPKKIGDLRQAGARRYRFEVENRRVEKFNLNHGVRGVSTRTTAEPYHSCSAG
jgi:hypothetical protein